jgi:hypothetical protein
VTKESVLAAFERDIQNGDPKMGDSTIEDIKKTAATLIVQDRKGVIEALRYWLSLRDIGLTPTALCIIADVDAMSELKPDLDVLRLEIESSDVFHPSYLHLIDLAVKSAR